VLSVESGAKVRIIFKSANNLTFFSRNNRIFAAYNKYKDMIYPQNFEQKIGFDQIRQLLKDKCLSTLGEERVSDMSFTEQFEEVEEKLTR
jgi:DNA mismatch repair protein MutS2